MPFQENLKSFIIELGRMAGDIINAKFRTSFEIKTKEGPNNLVTEVDQEVEQLLRQQILRYYPTHSIIGEEFEAVKGSSEFTWIIDPIDGTTNFAHGLPFCCVSIALLINQVTQLAVVYNPLLEEFYFAEKDGGAFLNGQPIQVSVNGDLNRAFLATGYPFHFNETNAEIRLLPYQKLLSMALPIRRIGTVAMEICWVANGRLDGFWEYHLKPWDIAGAYLVLQEAGGSISDFSGKEVSIYTQQTLATNGKIHEALRKVLEPSLVAER